MAPPLCDPRSRVRTLAMPPDAISRAEERAGRNRSDLMYGSSYGLTQDG